MAGPSLPHSFLFFLCLGLLGGGRGGPAQGLEQETLQGQASADLVQGDPHLLLLQGQAVLNLQVFAHGTIPPGFYQLRADRIRMDLRAERTEAEGNVSLVTPQGEIPSAQGIQLDLRTLQGRLQEAHFLFRDPEGLIFSPAPADLIPPEEIPDGLRLYAQEVDYSPQHLSLRRAYLTTSDRQPPQYSLRADSMSLQGPRWFAMGHPETPNWSMLRFQVRRVSAYLGERRLFTLPGWTLSGAHAERELFWLNLGYSPVDGWYTRLREGATWGHNWRGDLNLRLGTHNGITGVASLTREVGPHSFRLAITRQERVPDRLRSATRVSRLPEWSYTWTSPPARRTSPRRPVASYTLQGSVGRYEDLFEHQQAQRSRIAVTVRGAPQRWGRVTGNWGGQCSQSWYDTEDRFSTATAWASLELAFPPCAFVQAIYRTHEQHGRTPLPSLDEVDIPQELQLTTHLLVDRNWFVGLEGRYNLTQEDFATVEYTLARRIHLLQYGLTWRHQPDTRFDLHARILGF